MSQKSLLDQSVFLEELQKLRADIHKLEKRVTQLEKSGPNLRSALDAYGADGEKTLGAEVKEINEKIMEEGAYSAFLIRLATVSFALAGALILRVVSQQGLLNPVIGTYIGLSYCALLLFAQYFIKENSFLKLHGIALQFCGVILAPIIILEMFNKFNVMNVSTATSLLVAAGISGSLLSVVNNTRYLSFVSLVSQIIGITALGVTAESAGFRGAGIIILCAGSLLIAHKKAWRWLRPSVFVPSGLIFGFVILATARRQEYADNIAGPIMICAAALWAFSAVNHAIRYSKMDVYESVWLPLLSIWLYWLAFFYAQGSTESAAAAAISIGLLISVLITILRPAALPAFQSLIAAIGVISIMSTPVIDVTGIRLTITALIILWISKKLNNSFIASISHVMIVTALLLSIISGKLYLLSETLDMYKFVIGSILCLLFFCHYWISGSGKGSEIIKGLSPISLISGGIIFFIIYRVVVFSVFGEGEIFQTVQTAWLAVVSASALFGGNRFHRNEWFVTGIIVFGLLSVKVVFIDLFTMQGPFLLLSVIILGIASIAASIAIKWRAARK